MKPPLWGKIPRASDGHVDFVTQTSRPAAEQVRLPLERPRRCQAHL